MKVEHLIILSDTYAKDSSWVDSKVMVDSDELYTGPCPEGVTGWELDNGCVNLVDEWGDLILMLGNVPFKIVTVEVPDSEELEEAEESKKEGYKENFFDTPWGVVVLGLGALGLAFAFWMFMGWLK